MPLGGKDVTEVIKALEKNKKFLRTEIAHKINLKYAPDLRFRVDESFEKSAVIDKLLHSDKVRQDLAKPVSDEDDDADVAGDAK
jgi:ribosome-binding factor A